MLLHHRLSRQFLEAASRIRRGTLIVTTPEGVVHGFGGHEPGPDAGLIVHDWRMVPALAGRGAVGLREACRKGWCDTSDPQALLMLAQMNADLVTLDGRGHRLRMLVLRVLDVLNRSTGARTALRRRHSGRWLLPAVPERQHDL